MRFISRLTGKWPWIGQKELHLVLGERDRLFTLERPSMDQGGMELKGAGRSGDKCSRKCDYSPRCDVHSVPLSPERSPVRCGPSQSDEIEWPHVARINEGLMPKRRQSNRRLQRTSRCMLSIALRASEQFSKVLSTLDQISKVGVSAMTVYFIGRQLGWW